MLKYERMEKILISACLVGDNVKYNGGNNLTANIDNGACGFLQTDVNAHYACLEISIIHSYWLVHCHKCSDILPNNQEKCVDFSKYLIIMGVCHRNDY